MKSDELDSALERLVDMAESATARLDQLAAEVKQIRSIVEGLRYRAEAEGSAKSAPADATGNPTPAEQGPQAPQAPQAAEVISK